MRCHYLALLIAVFILSIDYAVPFGYVFTIKNSPFYVVPEMNETEPDWDLLVFTQQWPVTVCREWMDRSPKHTCSMPEDPGAWSIHGIWPTKLHTMGPSFCNRTWHFDPNLIEPIEKRLNTSWMNIESGTSMYALWAHEWTKHGTCAAVLEPFNSELKYFSKGIEWFQKYNMKTELDYHKVFPSNEKGYLLVDLVKMLNLHYPVNPIIHCWREHGKNWLSEIRYCFNKKLYLVDCDGVMNMRPRTLALGNGYYVRAITNCNANEPIMYPKSEDAFPAIEYTRSVCVPLYLLITWLQWFTL